METLWRRWRSRAEMHPGRDAIVWTKAGEKPVRWTWERLLHRAGEYAARLSAAGIRRGDVCALVIRHHSEFYPLYLGVEAAGAIPAVLAYPNPRLHPEKFRDGLRGMAAKSGLDFILTERQLEHVVRELSLGAGAPVRGILFPLEDRVGAAEAPPVEDEQANPEDPCLLQHSSGTTGLQKAVVLSHRAVLEHVDAYGRSIDLSATDRVVSWLPLYHDMGLIACFHLPLAAGVTSVQLDPFEWVQAPVLLLEEISRELGTLVWLPNFAFNLMADRIQDDEVDGLSLESVRMIVSCSEPVRAESLEKFQRRFERFGLRPGSLAACYAMAETTFAVTQTRPGVAPRDVPADRAALAKGRFELSTDASMARRCVSSGRPIEGCEIRVTGEAGENVADGIAGEIVIRSTSLFSGYRNQPEKTAEVLSGGWFRSGDLGFVLEGETFVIGRRKDIIIVAGKNVYPEDVEDAVSSVEDVLPGRVVAFPEDDEVLGTDSVAVAAETPLTAGGARDELRRRIVDAGQANDVAISRVYLVPPRWMIKSSAGKPSRSANRARLGEGGGDAMEALK